MAYEDLKAKAEALGINIKDLRVLDASNDPFYCGTPAQREAAEWFGAQYRAFGFRPGVHIRAIHYRLQASSPPVLMPGGEEYVNTKECAKWLDRVSKWARILRVVSPGDFSDARTPQALQHMKKPLEGELEERGWQSHEDHDPDDWSLGLPSEDLTSGLDDFKISLYPIGYEYRDYLQPYHLELWVEKDTMTSEVIGPCRRHSVNLVVGKGDASITAVIRALRRIAELDKPTRIFYLSDYDPKGLDIPVAVARKFEFWRELYAPDSDVKLHPLGLTFEQIQHYELPPKPLEEKHRGTAHAGRRDFYVELDALEGTRPGELARLVEREFALYRDPDLAEKLEEAKEEAQRLIDEAARRADPALEADLEALRRDARRILEPYEEELREMNRQKALELRPILERLEALRQRATAVVEDLDPDLEELPEPETEADYEWGLEELLYDSERDEDEQLEAYRSYRERS